MARDCRWRQPKSPGCQQYGRGLHDAILWLAVYVRAARPRPTTVSVFCAHAPIVWRTPLSQQAVMRLAWTVSARESR